MANTPEDILKEAILLEMKGKAFYQNVADKSDSEAAKKIFQMMADGWKLLVWFKIQGEIC